jgi:hypothetical protein
MFHNTAKALNNAAEARHDAAEGAGMTFTANVQDIDLDIDVDALATLTVGEPMPAPSIGRAATAVTAEDLRTLHSEYRWADSRLMQSSERLAEAQEARRKDLVALACMRRELRASFAAERRYVAKQIELFESALPGLRQREQELDVLVGGGALTQNVVRDLAVVRGERKLLELAIGQGAAQIARIEDADATLEYEVASEAYDREPDGRSMREVARLRALSTKLRRSSVRARSAARDLLTSLGIDTSQGEVTAIASFLSAEFEGDARGIQRMERVRGAQVAHELTLLPQPTSPWKAGLRHPVNFMRSRRISN